MKVIVFPVITGWSRATTNPMIPISAVNNTIKTNPHSNYIGVRLCNFTLQSI